MPAVQKIFVFSDKHCVAAAANGFLLRKTATEDGIRAYSRDVARAILSEKTSGYSCNQGLAPVFASASYVFWLSDSRGLSNKPDEKLIEKAQKIFRNVGTEDSSDNHLVDLVRNTPDSDHGAENLKSKPHFSNFGVKRKTKK